MESSKDNTKQGWVDVAHQLTVNKKPLANKKKPHHYISKHSLKNSLYPHMLTKHNLLNDLLKSKKSGR